MLTSPVCQARYYDRGYEAERHSSPSRHCHGPNAPSRIRAVRRGVLHSGEFHPSGLKSSWRYKLHARAYYLFCRALELILKAHLLAENVADEEKLKKRFGHDLERLWRQAKDHGIVRVLGARASHFEADLARVNTYYKDKVFEYFDFGRWARNYHELPPLERFRDEVKRIVEETKKHCFDVS